MHQFAEERIQEWPNETKRIFQHVNTIAPTGIFATGIENSDPWVDGGRRNQLKEAEDFEANLHRRLVNIRNLGITWLRLGVGYSTVHPGEDRYDFALLDKALSSCKELGITVIADLLHFGLPEWLHVDTPETPFFQNPHFPLQFARYVLEFTKRYPDVRYFTPINEPMLTARFSAKDGLWNEKIITDETDQRPYVRALTHIARAAILSRQTIETVWQEEKRDGEPLFFQNESFETSIAMFASNRQQEAAEFNTQRFAVCDLIFGHRDESVKHYLERHGMTPDEYEWFMSNGSKRQTILGIDFYPWSVYQLDSNGRRPIDPHLGSALSVLTTDYWKRYKMPLFHMEVNGTPEHAVEICQQTYDSLRSLREVGYPILGMSWFGDELQVGWQTGLVGDRAFEEHRVGLFYKGAVEEVAHTYADIAKNGFPPLLP